MSKQVGSWSDKLTLKDQLEDMLNILPEEYLSAKGNFTIRIAYIPHREDEYGYLGEKDITAWKVTKDV